MNNARPDRSQGEARALRPLPSLIFASRWLQLLIAQTGIHITFLLSAMALAACDRITTPLPARAGH